MPVWLSILGVCVVFTGFLGAAATYLRGSKDQGTIGMLNRHSDAQDIEIKDLKQERDRIQRDFDALMVRVATLEKDKADLAAERPSADVLVEIRQALTTFVSDAKTTNGEIKTLLMAIASIIQPKDEG